MSINKHKCAKANEMVYPQNMFAFVNKTGMPTRLLTVQPGAATAARLVSGHQ